VTFTAKYTTPLVRIEARIDDDNDLHGEPDDEHADQADKDSPIDNENCDRGSNITDEIYIEVVTQNCVMLEMLLNNQTLLRAEQRLEQDRMAAE